MVLRAPHPYRRWVTTVAAGAMGAGTSLLAGGGWLIVLTSIVSAAVIFRVLTAMSRRDVPGFFSQAIGAAVPTVFAIGLAVVQDVTDVLHGALPSLVVASGIVVLLAGLSLVGAAQDAIEGFYVTAGARVFQVLVLTLGIVVGIVLVLGIAGRLGVVPGHLAGVGDPGRTRAPARRGGHHRGRMGHLDLHQHLEHRAGRVRRRGRLGGVRRGHGQRDEPGVRGGPRRVGHRLRDPTGAGKPAVLGARRHDGRDRALLPGRAVYRGLFEIVSGANDSGLYQGLARCSARSASAWGSPPGSRSARMRLVSPSSSTST
jgi:hypothetical protein